MVVGVIGSGTMGSGIAQVAATAGCKVKVFDTKQEALDKSQKALEKILSRLIEKGANQSQPLFNYIYVRTAVTYLRSS